MFRTLFLEEIYEADLMLDEETINRAIVSKKHGIFHYNGQEISEDKVSNLKFISSPLAFVQNELYNKKDRYSNI